MVADLKQLIEWRRWFHQNPELSNEEFQTTARLREILESYDIRILDLPLKVGLIAEVGEGEDMIAIRSDIDALPINEKTNLAYQSQNDNVMHACGHDIHMASILGTAVKLKEMESELTGRVRIIFQSAEETGDGAPAVVQTGALDGALAILGFHNAPTIKVGEWRAKSGHLTSNVDRFNIRIQGRGAHAAMPQDSVDPQIVLGQLILSIQTIVSRNIAPYDEAVVTVGQIHSGHTWNVIPQEAMVEGTVRSFKAEIRDQVEERMTQICEGLEKQFNVKIDLDYHRLTASVVNDEKLQNMALEVAQSVGYETEVLPSALTIGEDFSGYQAVAPVHFAMIGSDSEYPLHHEQFQPNEQILDKVPDYFIAFIQRLWDEHLRR